VVSFQKPGDPAELAVDLCNTWDTLEEDPEILRDVAALRRFLDRHGLEAEAEQADARDLERVRALRDGLRAAFEAGDDTTAVELLNGIAAAAGATPRLERVGGSWDFRYAPAAAGLGDSLAAATAVTLLEVVRADGWDRFGICDGSPCCCVYVDRSKNRSRRFCSDLCADRVAQAAYRRRRASR
jgi:predicted RNA-binding Zn ribbon-like protein